MKTLLVADDHPIVFEATKRAIALGIACVSLLAAIMIPAVATAGTQPEAVDLGLSVEWADRNLGADSPTATGDYYAFGETSVKDVYDWSTYIHCDGMLGTCHDLGSDNIAGSAYDPAALRLGNGWRLPTAAECEELLDACTFKMTTFGDTCTLVLTAPKNGNSIILPLAGYMTGSRLYTFNSEGAYMTGTCEYESYGDEWSDLGPYSMLMNKSLAFVNYGSPHFGLTIRPVRDKESSLTATPAPATEPAVSRIYSIDGRCLGTSDNDLPSVGIFIVRMSDGTSRKIIRK